MPPRKHVVGEEREPVKVTAKQQELLMQLMLERPRLGTGKLDRGFTNIDRKNGWLEVIDQIHTAGLGPMKSYDKWLKCWQDLKSKIKAKRAAIGRSRRLTGGGEGPMVELSALEERVVAEFFSDTLVFGDANVEEAGIPTDIIPITVESVQAEVTDFGLPDGAQRIQECAAGPSTGDWVTLPVLPAAPSAESQELLSPLLESAVPAEQDSGPEAGCSATPMNIRKRRRVHATEATLNDTVSIARKYAREQEKNTLAMASLAKTGEQLVHLMCRQVAAAELQAEAAQERAAAAVRRAAATERSNELQAALLERLAAVLEKFLNK